MRLDLKDIIHVPGASKDFQFQLDLSQLEFYGSHPISRPVEAAGTVTNHAGALELTGTARSLLDLACDRCGKEFSREKAVPLDCLLADELEDEENDDILLLDGDELDVGEAVTTAFILDMDTKNLCKEDCKGLCPTCGANLNETSCNCGKREVDPRLAALAQLLDP